RHFLIRGGLYIKKTLLNRNFTAVEHCFFAYPVFYRTVILKNKPRQTFTVLSGFTNAYCAFRLGIV
ncbi:MAG: hypothetical protein LBJ63_04255, partial [Prevotellaceae bacterium]|nr:hypothetical protein [Prevotellaceae bacterium]